MDEEQRSLIAELRRLSVCQLLDGLERSCPVETAIGPIDPQFRICGPAFTVECAPGDNLTIHHALHLAQPGDVLVVSSPPNCDAALWGELMSISAQSKGLAGTIIDGPVRDPLEIRALGYPIFFRSINPRRATKINYGRINIPVSIGAIWIRPGDLVLADANGIVCIPRAQSNQTVQLASAIVRKENDIKDQMLSGRSLFDIFNLEQYVVAASRHPAKME